MLSRTCIKLGATNVVPGIGGAEAETIEAARDRARAHTRRVTRAVTARDFEELALATPGVDVARARAAVGAHPRHACPVADAVTVFILPWVPRGAGGPATAEAIASFSANRRRIAIS